MSQIRIINTNYYYCTATFSLKLDKKFHLYDGFSIRILRQLVTFWGHPAQDTCDLRQLMQEPSHLRGVSIDPQINDANHPSVRQHVSWPIMNYAKIVQKISARGWQILRNEQKKSEGCHRDRISIPVPIQYQRKNLWKAPGKPQLPNSSESPWEFSCPHGSLVKQVIRCSLHIHQTKGWLTVAGSFSKQL